jgi:hypothetical protein
MVEARKPRSYKIGTLTAAKEDSGILSLAVAAAGRLHLSGRFLTGGLWQGVLDPIDPK